MDPRIYEALANEEDTHWWFRARRTVCAALLRTIPLPPTPSILDVGCGSGGNLPMLSPFGTVHAVEPNHDMLAYASRRNIGEVEEGSLPHHLPFPGKSFDLITLFDVLEHIEHDAAALQSLATRLNPGGVLFLTVPAFSWLMGSHDREHHHFRRYGKSQLNERLQSAGLNVEYLGYWNCLLFPIAVVVRLANALGILKDQPGVNQPSPLVNTLLYQFTASERHLVPRIRLPFGLSLIAVARKSISR